MSPPFRLSCHCGAIRLEVDAALDDLVRCNCSTCRRFGALHWYVKTDQVKLVDERRHLSTYVPQALHAGHHFCGTCGTSICRTGYPDGVIALNANCIDEIDPFTLDVKDWDGRTRAEPGITR